MENLKEQIEIAVEAFKSGRMVEAQELTEKLINNNPKTVFLYNLLGLIFMQQGAIDEAISFYEKGIKIDPNFSIIYNNLALIFANNKPNYSKAEDLYKKSILLNQKNPEAQNNLGALYKLLDRFDEAISCFKKAIRLNKNFVQAYHNLGNIFTTMGNYDEAKKILNKAVKINPLFTNSHRTLSRLLKYTKTSDHFIELKRVYKKIDIKDIENKTNMSFALGKAYEDIGDYNNSFKFYSEANSLYKSKAAFSIDNERNKFKNVKEIFHKAIFDKYIDCGNINNSPIFILGMPRSGTTLIEQILSGHSKVFGGDEQEFIIGLLKKYFGNKNLKYFFEEIVKFEKTTFELIGEDYIKKMRKISNNSEKFTDKMPENFFWIGLIKLILPKAKIIHCSRNQEDNCLSIFKNHFPGGRINYSYDLKYIVEYYNLYSNLMKHWHNLLPNFIFDIKYENLIYETESQVKNMLKFCELKWDDSCIHFYKNRRPIKTASDTQARQKIYNSSINLWKKYETHLNPYFKKLNN